MYLATIEFLLEDNTSRGDRDETDKNQRDQAKV